MFEMPKNLKTAMKDRIAETLRRRHAETQQSWLDGKAVERGHINTPSGGQRAFWVVPSPGYSRELAGDPTSLRYGRIGGLNGYIHFAPKPLVEPEDGGILRYVKVHGGITYWGNHDGGVVYGFDTGHYQSNNFPITDPGWVREEIFGMMMGIEKAATVEASFLAETDEEKRIAIAQQVCNVRPEVELGFGALLNLLGGKV